MKMSTTEKEEIIEVIIDCILADTLILEPERYHKRYPGITLNEVKQDHICNLIIDYRADQYFRLSEELNYGDIVDYYKEVENLGYSDCISSKPERPAGENNIFLTEYCSGLRWARCKTAVSVDVTGVYINFGLIEKTLMRLQMCRDYGFTLDGEKIVEKIKDNVNSGMYDLHVDDDDYI